MHLTPNKRIGLVAGGSLVAGILTTFLAKKVMAKTHAVAPGPQGPQTITATDQDSGKSYSLQVGDNLVIKLPANPASGSDWQMTAVGESIIGNATPTFVPATGGAPGGTDVWTVAAKKGGTTTLTATYAPVGGLPTKTVHYTVTVAGADQKTEQPTQVKINWLPVSTLTPSGLYLFAGPAAGFADRAALLAALQNAGWTNVAVNYFGPGNDPATAWPAEMPWPALSSDEAQMYVAGGTYSGSAPSPVAQGLVVYQLGAAVTVPATPTVVPYKGTNILVVSTGQIWIANAKCTKHDLQTLLGDSTGLAIGSSAQEVTTKMSVWLDTNCQ